MDPIPPPPPVTTHCTIPLCNQSNPELKLYEFPATPESTRSKWIEFARISRGEDPRSESSWIPDITDRICSAHFTRNFKSDIPSKSNSIPTIYPPGLVDLPPTVKYDLRDLVCWWVNHGEKWTQSMHPIIETTPRPKQTAPEIKSLTLVQVTPKGFPGDHPQVKSYIKISQTLKFEAYVDNRLVPPSTILREDETLPELHNMHELKYSTQILPTLNVCIGTGTSGFTCYPRFMKGSVLKKIVNGEERERLVSENCERMITYGKVCRACKKLWTTVFEYSKKSANGKMSVSAPSVEDKMKEMERMIENYKVEVGRLVGRNDELTLKLGNKRKRDHVQMLEVKRNKIDKSQSAIHTNLTHDRENNLYKVSE